jgi:hypothetical protein
MDNETLKLALDGVFGERAQRAAELFWATGRGLEQLEAAIKAASSSVVFLPLSCLVGVEPTSTLPDWLE